MIFGRRHVNRIVELAASRGGSLWTMTRRKRPHSEKRKRRRAPPVKGKPASPTNRSKGREMASHADLAGELPVWMDEHGMHAMIPGIPDPETFEQLTQLYQQKIRNSPLWDEMVSEFGLEKAEQLLKEFRAQPG